MYAHKKRLVSKRYKHKSINEGPFSFNSFYHIFKMNFPWLFLSQRKNLALRAFYYYFDMIHKSFSYSYQAALSIRLNIEGKKIIYG